MFVIIVINFGNAISKNGFLVEKGLKEMFSITRKLFLSRRKNKRQVVKFKSIFLRSKEGTEN